MPRTPGKLGRPPGQDASPFGAQGGTVERYDRRLHVRVGEADVGRARVLADTLGITTSALVRLLLQLPAEGVTARCHVALDLALANRLYRELNQ